MVNRGLVWSIGTGENVSVWNMNWIPRASCFKPMTPDLYQLGNIVVSNFIKPNREGWDVNLLQCVLWECDVAAILQIPVCGGVGVGVRGRFFSNHGYDTVRSAYYVMSYE